MFHACVHYLFFFIIIYVCVSQTIDVPPPTITINITCDEVKVEWGDPILINSGGITIPNLAYTVSIQGTDIVNTSSEQSLLIPYNSKGVGGLEYHKQYTVSVAATYCNGMTGNVSSESFYTAMSKLISTLIFANTYNLYLCRTTVCRSCGIYKCRKIYTSHYNTEYIQGIALYCEFIVSLSC